MDLQNLAYALTQVAHNFGAVTVAATPLFVVAGSRPRGEGCLLWLVLAGWGVQIASGVLFGLVSHYYYGQFPDIHGIAVVALAIKVLCAGTAFLLTGAMLRYRKQWTELAVARLWRALAALGATALTAAAFLRWFS